MKLTLIKLFHESHLRYYKSKAESKTDPDKVVLSSYLESTQASDKNLEISADILTY